MISRSTDVVKVGDASYNKVERSMAVLNVFIDFIQVFICRFFNQIWWAASWKLERLILWVITCNNMKGGLVSPAVFELGE